MTSGDATHPGKPETRAPGAAAGGAAKARTRPRRRPLCTEVTLMEDAFQKLADRLLVEGATFEEVIETVAERGGPRLTLGAVRDYFRRIPTLQVQRVRHLVEGAKRLKGALGDPNSGEADLADAAFFTGYMTLSRNGPEPTLAQAERARYQRENLQLKGRLLRLKEKRDVVELDYVRAHTAFEKTRRRKAEQELKKLLEKITQHDHPHLLGADTIAKIQEIYGLVKLRPPAPPGLEAKSE